MLTKPIHSLNMDTSRKRPLIQSSSPGDEGYAESDSDQLKRMRNHDPLESIALIPEDRAWNFGTGELLDSPTTIPSPGPAQLDGNNFKNYDPSKSLFVLCVLGDLTLPLDLL
jgi:hypothetical protein